MTGRGWPLAWAATGQQPKPSSGTWSTTPAGSITRITHSSALRPVPTTQPLMITPPGALVSHEPWKERAAESTPPGQKSSPLPWKSLMSESASVPANADALAREVMRLARNSPADRSVLRHSLGMSPKEVALGVHRIVVPFVPDHAPESAERAYYAVAALIASQPRDARARVGDVQEDSAPPPQRSEEHTS